MNAHSEQDNAKAVLLSRFMLADLEGIKQALEGPNPPSLDPNRCLLVLSYNDNAECLKYMIPLSDPTHNHSEALRNAVESCNPISVGVLLLVSAIKDCEDVLCEIVDHAIANPKEEWLTAVELCVNTAPKWSAKALCAAIQKNQAAVADILYPHVDFQGLKKVVEENSYIENATYQELRTRFKLQEIKVEYEIRAQTYTKKL